MRTRERLIEVLDTVNSRAAGDGPTIILKLAVDILSGIDCRDLALRGLAVITTQHQSPHIRELADEALHYLREDANG